jgi:signal transduction histidine kinase/response regulator of citrate/malate metabolism
MAIPIRVLPPWYRTWWARSLALLTILSVAGLILYYWQRQVRARYELSVSEWKHRQEMELNERRLSFFTNISHEFRSPLSLIINPIREMLKNEGAQPDSFNLGIMYTNAQRLLKMTDRLLMFRKVDSEWGELECRDTDLLNLCRQVFFCFEDEARSKSLRYAFECGLEGASVFGDAEKIEIIVYNIISNAIKFCPREGEVVVALGQEEGRYLLSVKDTGPGIPPDVSGRVFEKFVHANAPQGFGIGLYLAKALADMHGATLTFDCPQVGGTIFYLSLPRQGAVAPLSVQTFLDVPETETAPPASGLEQELVSSRKTLLVIDNDRQVCAYIQHLFPDLVVHITENADDGWQKVQDIGPDIIISDIFMEGTDGIAFTKKLKTSNWAHTPVILLTGHAAPDIRLQGAESGADEFITKPFEAELLRARVYNMLKDRELLRKFFFNEITLQSNTLKISEEFSGFLAACISVVEEQIDRDDFDSKKFAKLMGMSRSRLYARVKSISGLSVNEFVKLIRLRKAAELMIHTQGQIKEISFQVGFNDIKYFREQFTRLFGLKPSDYIRRYRKNFQDNAHLNDQFSQIKGK